MIKADAVDQDHGISPVFSMALAIEPGAAVQVRTEAPRINALAEYFHAYPAIFKPSAAKRGMTCSVNILTLFMTWS